ITRAGIINPCNFYITGVNEMYPRRELNPYGPFGPLDFKSSASTSSATRVSGKKKSKHMVWTMSGRPGSNRPPRPWQGRALPNELLPLVLTKKELKGCKNKQRALLKKIFEPLI